MKIDWLGLAAFGLMGVLASYLGWLVFFGIHIGPERVTVAEIMLQAIMLLG